MRPRPEFRPCLAGSELEDRVVLSGTSTPQILPLPTHFGDDGSVLGQIRDQYIRQFRVSYTTLANQLQSAATTDLANGDKAALTTQVGRDLNALNSDLTAMLSLSPLAQNHLTPTIQQSIVGSGADSLKTQLGTLASTVTSTTTSQDLQSQALGILNASLRLNARRLVFFFSNQNPDRQQIAGAQRNAPALDLIHSSYETQYRASFATLGTGYTTAAQTMLNASDPTQIAANRPAFDTQVDTLVGRLTSTLTSMNSISPRAELSLTPQILERLIGGGTDSLESQLRALPTPTDTSGTSAQLFQTQSTTIINQALNDVLGDLTTFFARGRR